MSSAKTPRSEDHPHTPVGTHPPLALVAVPGMSQALTYMLPEDLEGAAVGCEVVVPVGKSRRPGWIIELVSASEHSTLTRQNTKRSSSHTQEQLAIFESKEKSIKLKSILSFEPAFLPSQIDLFKWMSEYYGVALAEILATVLPKRQSLQYEQYLHLPDPLSAQKILPTLEKKAPQQHAVLSAALAATSELSVRALLAVHKNARPAIKALEQKNLIQIREEVAFQPVEVLPAEYVKTPQNLTTSQAKAVGTLCHAISDATFNPFLLLGVTGSGKTEVYIQAIRHTLDSGGSALLLVPEISLTPQLVDQLAMRLAVPMALLHSQVGAAQRWRYWEGLRQGEFRLAVGARSALFAPMPNLRTIIIDEEHESSYKQSDGFRYHARDVAVMRAKIDQCTLILGSATPSLETLANVQRRRYRLLELPERVHQRPVPEIEIIDLLRISPKKMPAPTISPQLYDALQTCLAEKEQSIILYNKRGFSSYLQCETCGEALCCEHCSVALTYHKARDLLLCHYCGQKHTPPPSCPHCLNPETTHIEDEDASIPGTLVHRGAGTERVIEDLAILFPQARLLRMDRDTVGAKDSYRTILSAMRSGDADILVGTQMLAKGHDLPGVTLVGIIDADIGLHFPDFRTSERVYQLITQAAGRAGRGDRQGRVLVQTRQAQHPTIVATKTGRFKAFARYQLEQRERLQYPPYGRLLRIVVSATEQRSAIAAAETLANRLTTYLEDQNKSEGEERRALILGPAPAPHQRLRGMYRWHILIKAQSPTLLATLARFTHHWRHNDPYFRQTRIAVDVDPVDML